MPDSALSTSDRDQLRVILDDERRRTSEQVHALSNDLDTIIEASAVAPPDDEHDPEGATIGFERAQVASLLDRARRRLVELDRAEERLAAGTYGTCQHCGHPIEVERLVAHPTAPTCMECAGGLSLGLRRRALS
ncbi:MAG: DnaK suppressor protein [Actinomycetota bacterium]|jgi:RNA polymerase-binding transcription factor DksA|nr:DnaK suppressor protein [Actinomycetota bacterium]